MLDTHVTVISFVQLVLQQMESQTVVLGKIIEISLFMILSNSGYAVYTCFEFR